MVGRPRLEVGILERGALALGMGTWPKQLALAAVEGMFSDGVCRVTNCGSVKEIMMDVVVWTESEERERWWRAIVGYATVGDRCVATDVGEVPRRTRSVTPRAHASGSSSLHAASAA